MCGEAMEVPEASVFWLGSHGPITVPVESQVEEMSTPGAVTSGCTTPMRSPVYVVWPPAVMPVGSELSWVRPFEEKSPRCRSTVPAATEMTHGDWLNGLRLISAFSEPE